jgi:PAS domain S-box-containing protein
MGGPKRNREQSDALERLGDPQTEGIGKHAVTQLFQELKVQQEELTAQNHQLIETQHALEESRDRYVDLYDFAPIGYMTIDSSGMILEINFAGAALLGKERNKVVGFPFNAFVTASEKPQFSEHLRRCRQLDRESVTTEVTLNGSTSVQLITRLRSGNTGEAPVFLTALVDVTPRKQLEQERREAEETRQKVARDREFTRARADAKDHFLATLSHELRTPLTPIVATMSDDRLIALAPEPLRAALNTVRRNLELEVRLIDDLLDVTRISRDRLVLTHERVDLHVVAREVVDMLNQEIQRRDVRVVTALEASTHFIVGDSVRLRQVFWNLLGNSIKFTAAGGTVTVSSSDGPVGFVQVMVKDTGIGMERDMIDSINAEGEAARSMPLQSTTGLGLGLAICRGVITAHGGTLHARSGGTGRGSVFIVQLPIAAHTESPRRSAEPRQPEEERRAQRLRILLVEDHQDSADMLSQLLLLHDFEVEVANTVEKAVAKAREGFDLLISDIRLPDGSGLDLMRRLRTTQKIHGIAISGFGTEQDRHRSQEAGYAMHLTKPVDFNRLLEAIERVAPSQRDV